jgi:hypothetical protein
MKVNVNFYKHETPSDIILTFFHNKLPKKNIFNFKVTFQSLVTKNNKKMSISEAIKTIKNIGCWGYVEHVSDKTKNIHYWVKDYKNIELLINLIAHEHAHILYGGSEKTACQAGISASYAIKFLLKEGLLKI